jgi:hypothetical protein
VEGLLPPVHTAATEAATEAAAEQRTQRRFVMPVPPQPAAPVPPPAQPEPGVNIGTIEVTVVREAPPAPAGPDQHKPAAATSTTARSAGPGARISRALSSAHGFHQS